MLERYDAALQRHEQQQQQPVILVIDDLPKLRAEAERTDPSVELALHSILRLGRTANIRLVLNIPEPASPEDHVPEEARYNLGTFHRAFITPRPGRKTPMTISNDDAVPSDFLNEQMRASFTRRHIFGRIPPDVAQRLWSAHLTTEITLAGFLTDATWSGQRVEVLDRGNISLRNLAQYDNFQLITGLDTHLATVRAIHQLMLARYEAFEARQVDHRTLQPVVLAIDDLPGLLAEAEPIDPRIKEELNSISRLGRPAKVRLAVAVPGPTHITQLFGAETRDNFGSYHYVFRTPNTSQN